MPFASRCRSRAYSRSSSSASSSAVSILAPASPETSAKDRPSLAAFACIWSFSSVAW